MVLFFLLFATKPIANFSWGIKLEKLKGGSSFNIFKISVLKTGFWFFIFTLVSLERKQYVARFHSRLGPTRVQHIGSK